MFKVDYYCQNCGDYKTNVEIETMICGCGGDYRPDGALFGQAAIFDSYFDSRFGKEVTSYRQQEKEGKAWKTAEHPDGLMLINDDKKFMKECRHLKKHKEEYRVANMPYYKGGDMKRGYTVDDPERVKLSRRKTFVMAVICYYLLVGVSFALDGADYVGLSVKGVKYEIPIPNKTIKQEFYLIKKALAGDSIAREIILGTNEEKYYFIGDVGIVRWLVITKTDEYVTEHLQKGDV